MTREDKEMESTITVLHEHGVRLATMSTDLSYLKRDMNQIKEHDIQEIKDKIDSLKDCFVSQKEFRPVKSVVYGLVGIALTAMVGAIISLVIK